MSAYDPNLDKCISTTKIEVEGKVLEVNIMSYNGGAEKVAVLYRSTKDPTKAYPVNRMTRPQLEAVYRAVNSGSADPFEPPAEEPF